MKNKICSIGMIGIVLSAVLIAGNKQKSMLESVEMTDAVESKKEMKESGEACSYYVKFLWIDTKRDDSGRSVSGKLHETQGECEGTVFPAVKVTGMTDEAVQKKLNEHLQEGLREFILNERWIHKGYRQELLQKTKIYISYKSER